MLPESLPPGWDEADAEAFTRRFGWRDPLDLDGYFMAVCSCIENSGWIWVGGIDDGVAAEPGQMRTPMASLVMAQSDFPFFFWAWQQVAGECKISCAHPTVRFLHPSSLSDEWLEVRVMCRPIHHEEGDEEPYRLLRALLPLLDRERVEMDSVLSSLLG